MKKVTLTDKLNRLLKMHKRKLSALEKIQGAPLERIRLQQQNVEQVEQKINKLTPSQNILLPGEKPKKQQKKRKKN